jgi:hypothetical protein
MPLADCTIQELVTDHIKQYLSKNNPNFAELKALIVSKAPIPQIHSNIVTHLTQMKDKDCTKVQKALEHQAYKNQITEDEKQKKRDTSEESRDEEVTKRLKRQLNHIPTQLNNYNTERRLLEYKLSRLMNEAAKIEVTQHTNPEINKKISSSYEEYLRSIERVKSSIASYDIKIQALNRDQVTLHVQLNDQENRAQVRLIRHKSRVRRAQARTGYLSSGEGIDETLSSKNHTQLTKSIQDQHQALEKKLIDLIQKSEHINFSFFINELQLYLAQPDIKLKIHEIDALNACIKLMNAHLEFENQARHTQTSINIKKQHISSLANKLQEQNSRYTSLKGDNPHLTEINNQLHLGNIKLTEALNGHNNLSQHLKTAALLLLTLSFLFTIPLILTLTGVIPMVFAPALLYSLVAVPPALMLIATISVGIAALVYDNKANSNEAEIKNNLNSIEINHTKMNRNIQNLNLIQTTTIPKLEEQINKGNASQEHLALSLKKSQNQALEALKQAKEIQPVAAQSTLFSADSPQEESLSEVEESEEEDARIDAHP